MQTTIDLDEDVLRAAQALAEKCGASLGTVISDLARKSLEPSANRCFEISSDGFPILRPLHGGKPVTDQMVKELLESGY